VAGSSATSDGLHPFPFPGRVHVAGHEHRVEPDAGDTTNTNTASDTTQAIRQSTDDAYTACRDIEMLDERFDHDLTDEEVARRVFQGDIPECPDCGDGLGTNGGCLTCIYAYESHVHELDRRGELS